MKSLWNSNEAKKLKGNALDLRVYTSRLLGKESSLVMHGGGNTSVKDRVKSPYGEWEDILYVKGSGWDLATIEREGFAPVRMEALLKMAEFKTLDDRQMVKLQRAAMIDPYAPNPSVEAVLHAIIPFKFVDHTHADAVVTITNTSDGHKRIKEIYGDNVVIIPYIMPGFILAREIYRITKDLDWSKCEALILLNHGVFTFDEDAKKSYEKMIKVVTKAEKYLSKNAKVKSFEGKSKKFDVIDIAKARKAVSIQRETSMLASLDNSSSQVQFSNQSNLKSIATRGTLTPDHVIRTKKIPVILGKDVVHDINDYADEYYRYFKNNKMGKMICLDKAPRWAVWSGCGTLSFGRSVKEMQIINDIKEHTTDSILKAEALGGWKVLSEKDIFEMEYWVLEQAKLAKKGVDLPFQGKVALVTGAASGIGFACVEEFESLGGAVVALDINPKIEKLFKSKNVMGIKADLTKEVDIKKAITKTICAFGGIDIVVSNAGIFPASEKIDCMQDKMWAKSVEINLTSHQKLMTCCIPFLKEGIDSTIIIIASKNVPAPGPGASAYSVPKAGLTQLGRVAALELAEHNIRVNMLHPNAVFDTAIWTDEVLKKRAKSYGISVQEYKTNNLLKTEVTSKNVAKLVSTMASDVFSKTTGAQVPIDGGNERVI